ELQFSARDDRDVERVRGSGQEASVGTRKGPTQDVADDVGVEQTKGATRHQKSRSCGGSSCRSARKSRASARAASRKAKKSAQSRPAGRPERITSPVRGSLRTETSVPSKRNLAGRRTAWLFPLVKSLAVRAVIGAGRQ